MLPRPAIEVMREHMCTGAQSRHAAIAVMREHKHRCTHSSRMYRRYAWTQTQVHTVVTQLSPLCVNTNTVAHSRHAPIAVMREHIHRCAQSSRSYRGYAWTHVHRCAQSSRMYRRYVWTHKQVRRVVNSVAGDTSWLEGHQWTQIGQLFIHIFRKQVNRTVKNWYNKSSQSNIEYCSSNNMQM